MEEETVKKLAALFLPAILAGGIIGYVHTWYWGLIVTVVLASQTGWEFRDFLLRREIQPELRHKLEIKWLKVSTTSKEIFYALGVLAAIVYVYEVFEPLNRSQLGGPISAIAMALISISLFVIYVFLRWVTIRRTTELSLVLVPFISFTTVFVIIIAFSLGYAATGIIDTNKERGDPNRILKISSEDLRSTDPDITEKIDRVQSSSIYFSVVTFTTLGYGDFQPTEKARSMAAVEALLGLVFMAFLIAVLFNLLREYSEQAAERGGISVLNVLYIILIMGVAALLIIDALPYLAGSVTM